MYIRIFAQASRALDSPMAHDIAHYRTTIWPTYSNTFFSTSRTSRTCTRDDTCKRIQYGEERNATPCTLTDVVPDKAYAHIHLDGHEKNTCVFTRGIFNTNASVHLRIIHGHTRVCTGARAHARTPTETATPIHRRTRTRTHTHTLTHPHTITDAHQTHVRRPARTHNGSKTSEDIQKSSFVRE